MNKIHFAMIHLVSCGINRTTPCREIVGDIDMEKLFSVCKAHFLEVIAGTALKQAGIVLPEKWTQKLSKSVRKSILFDDERKKLFMFMEQEGIWYLPLKGTVLKDYYPAVGMRQMSDNDILFDAQQSKKLRKYMESCGYKCGNIGKGAHDVYKKEPVYNFEMHRTLFDGNIQEIFHAYYADVKKRLLHNENSEYGYHFSKEDFYIYTTAHAYKHYSAGGTGLRTLLDFYVYLSAEEKNMDSEYIEKECMLLNTAEFEAMSRCLCKKVFSADAPDNAEDFEDYLSENERERLEYYLASGVYGTEKKLIENRISKHRKKTGNNSGLSYVLSRIFPGMEIYKSYYPFFYKHKLLLPIGWLYRLLRMIFSRKKRAAVVRELDIVRNK